MQHLQLKLYLIVVDVQYKLKISVVKIEKLTDMVIKKSVLLLLLVKE